MKKLQQLLEDLKEYMENKADILNTDNGPVPNQEMKFVNEIEIVLYSLKKNI